jgi:hypothetical protein
VLKKPKYDYIKFMENYVESSEQKKPAKVEGEADEAKNKLAE